MSPTNPVTDTVWPKLVALVACLGEAIERQDLPPLCYLGLKAGAGTAFDYVGNQRCLNKGTDGMGWVALETAFPTQNFPNPANAAHCGDYLAITAVMGIIRTYPLLKESEPLPPADELAIASAQITEMLVMQRAISCCAEVSDVILTNYTPIGPIGGAIGGMWRFTFPSIGDDD